MMNLAEIQPVATSNLPIGDLKDHLRLPDGFPDDTSFDDRLEQSLRAGLALVEARTGKALFLRQFAWQIDMWGKGDRLTFPIAPLVSVDVMSMRELDGTATSVNLNDFGTIADIHRPSLQPRSGAFPTLNHGAVVDILFTAGFGANWSDLPADLREAVLILAVDFFDAPTGQPPGMTPAVSVLLQRYQGISLGRVGV
ncbi:MAG: hypothetical protein AAGF88_08650 [Pseudomonadota bacterium]